MSLLIKSILFLFFFLPRLEAGIITVDYTNAENLKELNIVLLEKYKISPKLISYHHVEKCVARAQQQVLHLCLNGKGELRIMKAAEKIMRRSFMIFSQKTRGER